MQTNVYSHARTHARSHTHIYRIWANHTFVYSSSYDLLLWPKCIVLLLGEGMCERRLCVYVCGCGCVCVCVRARACVPASVHVCSCVRCLITHAQEVGALSTGVLLGAQAVLVFLLSGLLFCSSQPTQCLTITKVIGCSLVRAFAGCSLLFYLCLCVSARAPVCLCVCVCLSVSV